MPEPVSAGIAAVSTIGGAAIQSSAAGRAGRAQQRAADASIAEQRRQFDAMRELLQPYVSAGTPALQGMMDLAGLGGTRTDWRAYVEADPAAVLDWQTNWAGGPNSLGNMSIEEYGQFHYNLDGRKRDLTPFTGDPQARAISQIEGSPIFQTLARQGEDAIAQNASATGGLRGGNTQGALARFRPALLNQFIEQQYGRMAGIAGIGANAAAGVGNAGIQTGQNIGNTLIGAGEARAGAIGAQGQIWGNVLGQIGGAGVGMFGGRAPNAGLIPSVNGAIAANPGLF